MGVITRPYSFVSGNTILAAENNSNETTIYNEFNGNIENANIKSTAAIEESKLSLVRTFTSKTAAYTLTSTDDGLTCDASGGAFTVTLPPSSGIAGKEYTIFKSDASANAVTVDGNASETINGAATFILANQYASVTVKSDGTNWGIVSATAGFSTLTDPGADRVAFWDDSAGVVTWLTAGSGLTITDTTITSGSTSPTFSVHKNGTDQTGIVTATWTKVTWSTENWDTNSNFASDKFTPTVAGYYGLNAVVRQYDTGTFADYVAVYKNGVLYNSIDKESGGTTSRKSHSLSTIVYANGTTDYFEIYLKHELGSDGTIVGTAASTWFNGHKQP